MLRLRLTINCHPRTNSGEPAHNTTGVASTSSSHVRIDAGITRATGQPGLMSDISIAISGIAGATLIQKRRVMAANSGDFSSAALTTRGSSVIPQIGQLPGSERTIRECIGQTYSVFDSGWIGARGSSAIPHFGHDARLFCLVSGCIGQAYKGASAGGGDGAVPFGAAAGGSPRARKLLGSFVNLLRQRTLQKW
jgi:hypothetical protein